MFEIAESTITPAHYHLITSFHLSNLLWYMKLFIDRKLHEKCSFSATKPSFRLVFHYPVWLYGLVVAINCWLVCTNIQLLLLQVGPSMLVLGDVARSNGLSISLLERLLSVYRSEQVPPIFKQMISVLNHCHRCHRDILSLSSELFYSTVLKIPENEDLPNHPKFPYPLIFVCSSVKKDCTSKSTMNPEEAKIVLNEAEIIAAKWSKRLWGDQYHLNMCVMSPTRSQVQSSTECKTLGMSQNPIYYYRQSLVRIRRHVPRVFYSMRRRGQSLNYDTAIACEQCGLACTSLEAPCFLA